MSVALRVIPCLDVHDGRVVKGVNFRNLRDAGDPVDLATAYGLEGADELRAEWFDGAGVIGITAGASTPASQIEAVRARIGELVGE